MRLEKARLPDVEHFLANETPSIAMYILVDLTSVSEASGPVSEASLSAWVSGGVDKNASELTLIQQDRIHPLNQHFRDSCHQMLSYFIERDNATHVLSLRYSSFKTICDHHSKKDWG